MTNKIAAQNQILKEQLNFISWWNNDLSEQKESLITKSKIIKDLETKIKSEDILIDDYEQEFCQTK